MVRIPPIWIEYGEILRIFPYTVQIRENTVQKNSKYGSFSRRVDVHVLRKSLPEQKLIVLKINSIVSFNSLQ